MENKKIVYVKLGILIFCNLIIALTVYFSYQYDNIFAIFIYIIFGIISLFQFLNIIKSKHKIGIGISLLSFLTIISIYSFFEDMINENSFLKANMHGTYIDLKNNNTYIIKSGSWASKIHYYGKYNFNAIDSVITLDKNINNGTINSRKMKIKKFKNYIINDNKYHKFLIQLDNDNKEIKNLDENWKYYRFEIE
ncbi:hypothetical protein [Algoriella sp.]|uniref:hypothetical protein n=1 Tax=Algoriella sp. TaxID=1872434 RepID=UPI002FC8EB54